MPAARLMQPFVAAGVEAARSALYTPAMRSALRPLALLPLVLVAACSGKPSGGGNVTMHDMEVVDGTANDSMTDLDNATGDASPFANAGALPPMPGADSAGSSNAAQAGASNAAQPARTGGGNSGAAN